MMNVLENLRSSKISGAVIACLSLMNVSIAVVVQLKVSLRNSIVKVTAMLL